MPRSRRRIALAATALFLGTLSAAAGDLGPLSDAERGDLLVFVQSEHSPSARGFLAKALPPLEALAERMGVPLHVLDVRRGAPPEITTTPLLVFQNHRGRSIYEGRLTTLGRVESFVRTARYLPQGDESLTYADVPLWREGRARVAAPIKITDLTGTVPDGFDQGTFRDRMRWAIDATLARFSPEPNVTLGRGDRAFHMDFHPWRSPGGELFVSTSLYSEFHCKDPIHRQIDAPARGPFDAAAEVFGRAARELESAIVAAVEGSEIGDAFAPVPATVPVVSFEALGYPLPQEPPGGDAAPGGIELVRDWVVEPQGSDRVPAILFRFPAPLDNYAGTVGRVTGALTLGPDLGIGDSVGHVEADVRSVTMGEKDLDVVIRGTTMLHTNEHPTARFVIRSLEASPGRLSFGRETLGIVAGSLYVRGIERALGTEAVFEPVVGLDGRPRLTVTASFSIRLGDPFGIVVPIGSMPSNDTLLFDVHLVMAPSHAPPPGVPGDPNR